MLEIFKQSFHSYQRSKLKVLIVDDQEESCLILSKLLGKHGVQWEVCQRPQQAYWEIYDNQYDLVLLDIMMPKISGLQLLQEIRADFSLLALPVIIISAINSEVDMERAFKLGANDYITKPIHAVTAWARIQKHLELVILNNHFLEEKLYNGELRIELKNSRTSPQH